MNIQLQLNAEEGRRGVAYADSLGFLTIGVGRLIDAKKPGAGLSEKEIDYLLANDIEAKTNEVKAQLPWAANLNEPRLAVLVCMAFQLGTQGLLKFKNALGAAQTGRFDECASQMLDSKWARSDSPQRAARMAKQMITGAWQLPPGY